MARHKDSKTKDLVYHLSTIQRHFVDVMAFFTIAISVAAAVRLYQRPPFYERVFTLYLCLLLSASTVCLIASLVSFECRPGLIVFYQVVFLILSLKILFTSKASDFLGQCKVYGMRPTPGTLAEFLVMIVFCLMLFVILHTLILFFITKHISALRIVCVDVESIGRFTPGRIFLLLFPIAYSFYFLYALIKVRSAMREIAGEKFEDNRWGFGQVAALSPLVQFSVEVFYHIKGMCWSFNGLVRVILRFSYSSLETAHIDWSRSTKAPVSTDSDAFRMNIINPTQSPSCIASTAQDSSPSRPGSAQSTPRRPSTAENNTSLHRPSDDRASDGQNTDDLGHSNSNSPGTGAHNAMPSNMALRKRPTR